MGNVRRHDRGAAAVEFAIVLPLLLLILFGIFSYGIMLSFRQSISQSAAEGARAAATTIGAVQSPTDNARNAVTEALSDRGLVCAGNDTLTKGVGGAPVGHCTVVISHAACTAAGDAADATKQCAKVDVSYDYGTNPIGPKLPYVPMPSTLEYTSVVEMN